MGCSEQMYLAGKEREARERPLIVVVDDAREIVTGLSLRLRNAGYDVQSAFNGESGLALILDTRPDAMLIDVRMPVMDGLTMLSELNRSLGWAKIPSLVLTANIAERARIRAQELGARFFLGKPYDAATVLRAVELMLTRDVEGSPAPAGA